MNTKAFFDYLDSESIGYNLDKKGSVTVGGSLHLRGTGITELPDNLSVGGSLYLRGTGITELPDNLSVGNLSTNVESIKNITSKKNCGRQSRTLIAFMNRGEAHIVAGCFCGTLDSFCDAVDESYTGEASEKYKQDATDCVTELMNKLSQESAA